MGTLMAGVSCRICGGNPTCRLCPPGGTTEGFGTRKGKERAGCQGSVSGLIERVSSGGQFRPCYVLVQMRSQALGLSRDDRKKNFTFIDTYGALGRVLC